VAVEGPDPMTSRRFAAATLLERSLVARDTWTLRYDFGLDTPLVPGQFAMVHPGGDDVFVLPRPLSILDASERGLELLVKIAGRGSRALVEAPLGQRARIFAALGQGFDLPRLWAKPLILVAGGVGVVPLQLAARRLIEHGRPPLRALFGARSPEDLPRALWENGQGGDWELWVEHDATAGLCQGLVTQGLERVLAEVRDATILTCGPTPMMQAVARMGRAGGNEVWLCLEEQMGCGAGVCRACVVEQATEDPTKLTVCREGPVFELSRIRYLPEDLAGATGPQLRGTSCNA
jgi:dihydroorotate dehydrogenase electron transfer subunit